MMKNRKSKFIYRWIGSSLGLWIASELLGNESVSYGERISAVVVSGFILAVVNMLLKPLVIFLTLPAVLLTLGVFMVVINALMVLVAAYLYGPLEVNGFGIAVLTGLVIGLVNWLISIIVEEKQA